MGFIAASTLLFVTVGRPVTLLVLAGSLNGLILPLTLGTILFASKRKDIVGDYEHPAWLLIFGIIIVAVTLYMGITCLLYTSICLLLDKCTSNSLLCGFLAPWL